MFWIGIFIGNTIGFFLGFMTFALMSMSPREMIETDKKIIEKEKLKDKGCVKKKNKLKEKIKDITYNIILIVCCILVMNLWVSYRQLKKENVILQCEVGNECELIEYKENNNG